MPTENPSPEIILISDERRVMLSGFIVQVGERCRILLELFQSSHSMHEIGKIMGYSNEKVAANKVYECREKLKKIIRLDPEKEEVLKNRF